jgi:hypothetical protein
MMTKKRADIRVYDTRLPSEGYLYDADEREEVVINFARS